MICPKCKKNTDDENNYCPNCGNKLIVKNKKFNYKDLSVWHVILLVLYMLFIVEFFMFFYMVLF